SVEVIKKYVDKITYWISENDKGIYNAMNKGIERAKGEYCLFLNSGDFLCNKGVIKDVFSSNNNTDIIYGNMMIDWGNGKKTKGEMPDIITTEQMYVDTLWHPVSFIKRSLFEKHGFYNESYKIVADYDFFFKTIIGNKVSTKHLPILISEYNVNGLSSKPENKILEKAERKKVIQSYLFQEEIDAIENLLQKRLQKENRNIRTLLKKYFSL